MKNNFKIGLLIFSFIMCSSFVLHKFYVSVTQIDYVPNKKRIEITSRIFIDDLEIFLLSLYKKFNNPYRKFEEYLEIRQSLNGKIMSADELDICAMFLKNSIGLKKIINSHTYIIPDPFLQNIFDDMYFNKEIKVKLKYESKFIFS